MFQTFRNYLRRKQRLASFQARQEKAQSEAIRTEMIERQEVLRRERLEYERIPKVWAFFQSIPMRWTKVVSANPPQIGEYSSNEVIGPMKSEIDCEEFCDMQNLAICSNSLRFYRVQPVKRREDAKG